MTLPKTPGFRLDGRRAGAVLFLAADASAMVTGTSILIDGGWTAG